MAKGVRLIWHLEMLNPFLLKCVRLDMIAVKQLYDSSNRRYRHTQNILHIIVMVDGAPRPIYMQYKYPFAK